MLYDVLLKAKSEKFRELKRRQTPHTCSRRGYARVTDDMVIHNELQVLLLKPLVLPFYLASCNYIFLSCRGEVVETLLLYLKDQFGLRRI